MDIYIDTQLEILKKMLINKHYTITWKKNHFSATKHIHNGRYHILYLLLDGQIFCDFHYDNKIHGIGMGADYGTKPEKYFEMHLKEKLDKQKISYEVHQVNWFTRKNKAIITGLRF